MTDVNFVPKDILQKHFETKMRGYDSKEVDEFLDDVIKDYETFDKKVKKLQEENDRLIAQVDELTKQVTVGKSSQTIQTTSTTSNMDILKRLSNLERRVFGAQLDENENSRNQF
ncbi:cell division regulator GpsB [Dellaglioa sp. P0083]|uniref:cell division regulator GpsB n=1 Tax=Dellaglioa kimchii TaxID=3344667 RepID=UPI0038D3CAB5